MIDGYDNWSDYFKSWEGDMPDGYDVEHIKKYMQKKPKCIIVDLEGTLTDHRHRLHHYNNKNYDNWNILFPKDKPNSHMANMIKGHFLQYPGIKRILCTAKSEEYSEDVVDWLKHNGLYELMDMIMYRPFADESPSVEIKQYMLSCILEDYEVIHAYDDRVDIIKMYSKNNIPATLISVWDEVAKRASDILEENAKLHKEKNKEYGDGYKEFGKLMVAFFPNGLKLESESDFTRFAMLNIKIAKVDRYCKNFKNGGHKDSLTDISIYSAMLQEVDDENKGGRW